MIKDHIQKTSIRENLLNDVSTFLIGEGFRISDVCRDGVISIANLISDYYEEGQHLYPEVILTNDISILKTFPSYSQFIGTSPLTIESFKKALKSCAPLSNDGWVIFMEIKEDQLNYGLVSAEVSETSLPLHRQTINEENFPEDATLAYIRNTGLKKVEISGLKSSRR